MDNQFADDVREGLSSEPKFLHSKYFYNKKGDEIFQQIMAMKEYYLTDCEYEIFDAQKDQILDSITKGKKKFDLIEFGAGDGYKTKVLIEYFLYKKVDFTYMPVDISCSVLNLLEGALKKEFNDLEIKPICDEYFHALEGLNQVDLDDKVILFLGSNIGNFRGDNAIPFLKHIGACMKPGDKLLIGLDLKKDPEVILRAYNDPGGITRAFNFNLLDRINEELGADFDKNKFKHYPSYNAQTGETISSLISLETHYVYIKSLNQRFHFQQWEPLFMEISQKYDLHDIERMAERSGFRVEKNFFDSRNYFTDSLWVLK